MGRSYFDNSLEIAVVDFVLVNTAVLSNVADDILDIWVL